MRRPLFIAVLIAASVGAGAPTTVGHLLLAADPPSTGRKRGGESGKSTSDPGSTRTPGPRRDESPESNTDDRTPSGSRLLPKRSGESSTGEAVAGRKRAEPPSWWNTAGWLCGVVAIILIGARVLMRNGPLLPGVLPPEAISVLGRRMLGPRHSLHLVRCGRRLLVIGSSPAGLASLGEITDPDEVDHLSGLCRAARSGSVSSETSVAADVHAPVSRFATLFQRTAGFAPDNASSDDDAQMPPTPPVPPTSPVPLTSPAAHQLRERLQAAASNPLEEETDYGGASRDWPPTRRSEVRHA